MNNAIGSERVISVKKPKTEISDGIFLIVEERSCPIYDVGEEIKVEKGALSISAYKASCLILARDIINLVSSTEIRRPFGNRGGQFGHLQAQKKRYHCDGCGGMIAFEYKQEKDYATLQMKMLRDAEAQRRRKHLEKFYGMLRKQELFDSLEDEALTDLTLLLELKTFMPDKVIVKEGDPGVNLYIILKGRVAVIGDDKSKEEEMDAGGIFGAMGLLSGEPVEKSIHSIDPTQVAILSVKNFRTVLRRFPVLQIFLFKLLVERVQAATLRAGNITSGMTGSLDEISAVDLFQLINSAQKSGRIDLALKQGRGMVFFVDGEIVYAQYLAFRNKDALFRMLVEKKGRFSYARGVPAKVLELQPLGGFMGLMMEIVQQLDEESEGDDGWED